MSFAVAGIEFYRYRNLSGKKLDFTGPDGKPLSRVVIAGPHAGGKSSVLEALWYGIRPEKHGTCRWVQNRNAAPPVPWPPGHSSTEQLVAFCRRFADPPLLTALTARPQGHLSQGSCRLLQWAEICCLQHARHPDVLLIDTPELDLDVSWQCALARALPEMLPNTQIIMATHSAVFREYAYSFENFALLDPDDARSVGMRIPEPIVVTPEQQGYRVIPGMR